jgi:hypothetical protein
VSGSAVPEPTALIGNWRLTRQLTDGITGMSGTVHGGLTMRPGDERITWAEEGTLFWNGSRLPVSRSYRLERTGNSWWLHFLDGRPFHPWLPGEWVEHPCRQDTYRGLITISGPGQWDTVWEVQGPDKAQRIVTRFCRTQ